MLTVFVHPVEAGRPGGRELVHPVYFKRVNIVAVQIHWIYVRAIHSVHSSVQLDTMWGIVRWGGLS